MATGTTMNLWTWPFFSYKKYIIRVASGGKHFFPPCCALGPSATVSVFACASGRWVPFFDGVCAENGASPLTPPTSDWNILELDFLGADFSVAAENFQCAVSDTFRALPRIFCFRLPGAAGSGRGWCRFGWEVDVGVGVRDECS